MNDDPTASDRARPGTHSDRVLAGMLMGRQAALGLRAGAIFLVLILGIPLLNTFYPEVGATPVFGFPLTWFVLGLLFYPITWAISAYFVRASERLEAEDAELLRQEGRGS